MSNITNFIFGIKSLQKRDSGIDIVKSLAAFSVLSVHFFIYSGYYDIPITNIAMIIPTAFRWIFSLGVPLFLISTGFLKRKTKFTVLHYVKLLPVIVTALLAGTLVMLYKAWFVGESFPLFIWLRSLWSYEQPSYAWYINMYLCLALIMPFISYAWNAIENQRKKQMMIIVFCILTSLPLQINRWHVMDTNLGYAPNMWTQMYAITYFLIGAYIGEYRPKVKKSFLAVIFAFCIMYQSVKTYFTAYGGIFYEGVCAYYEDLITVFTGTVLFMLIYDIKLENKPLRTIFASISNVTLGLYLLSFIGDCTLYSLHDFSDGIKSMPLGYLKIVPLNFAISCIEAIILNAVTKLITNPIIDFAAKKFSSANNNLQNIDVGNE